MMKALINKQHAACKQLEHLLSLCAVIARENPQTLNGLDPWKRQHKVPGTCSNIAVVLARNRTQTNALCPSQAAVDRQMHQMTTQQAYIHAVQHVSRQPESQAFNQGIKQGISATIMDVGAHTSHALRHQGTRQAPKEVARAVADKAVSYTCTRIRTQGRHQNWQQVRVQ